MEFPDHQQQPNREYASMPAPFRPVADGPPAAEQAPEPEPTVDPEPDSMLPTMIDLRSVATDLDDIDEILARLDDDESAPDNEPNQDAEASMEAGEMSPSITDPAGTEDPDDQDPLLATR